MQTNSSNSKTYVNSAMTSPFIPLQAVKHKNRNIHINKSDSARQNAMGASTYRDDNTYTMNQLSKVKLIKLQLSF